MKRLELTRHTVRCPLDDRTASLTVRTNPGGYPSRRHLEIAACSHHAAEVACRKPCLAVLNAAEPGAAEPVRCTAGIGDSLELARHIESPAITRLLWFYSS